MQAGSLVYPLIKHAAMRGKVSVLYPVLFTCCSRKKLSTKLGEEHKELVIQEKLQISRPLVKKVKRAPFVKNFFCGIFDTDLMAFPEILDNEHLAELEASVKRINILYKDKVNSAQIEKDRKVPDDLFQDLKDMGLFGRMVPVQYGGLGLTYTEYTRLNEVIGLDWSIGTTLAAHELLGVKALQKFGSEAQKNKYLEDLASGKKISAYCSYEAHSGFDATSIKTTANFMPDGKSYNLNGVKSWVTNGAIADLFFVLAKIPAITKTDATEDETFVFLVDANSVGVTVSPCTDKICLAGANVAVVTFTDVVVPAENIVGESGFQIVNALYETSRFGMSSLTLGALKALLDHAVEFAINTDRLERPLADIQLIRAKLQRIAQRIYIMESVSYYTAAIYDSTEDPDCLLESAISKIVTSEGTLYCLRELMKLFGVLSLSKFQQLERFYRDAQGLESFECPNDIIRIFLGLSGCQYHGARHAELVMKTRNPFYFPWDRFKFFAKARRVQLSRFNYNQDVAGHLHPSLVKQGNFLEESVQRLEFATASVLVTHGQNVTETQYSPVRLGNMVIDIYTMAAVLSRCSRSYCIGLKNATHELRLADSICLDARASLDSTFEKVIQSYPDNDDDFPLLLGEQVVENRGYFPEHPLKHNF